jgi:outer membrane protein OmpA-like peptidoglycan-associated protein
MSALESTEQAVIAGLPPSYVVPFDSGSDIVGGEGLNVATAVARAVPLVEPARIDVVGYADRSGSAAANEALSLRRAENMAAALERAGVSRQLLNIQSRGAAGAPLADVAGRRVEVSLRS